MVLYNYYNWRQDTVSDLLLILTANSALILTGALVKMQLVDPFLAGAPDDPWAAVHHPADAPASFLERFWPDVYRCGVEVWAVEGRARGTEGVARKSRQQRQACATPAANLRAPRRVTLLTFGENFPTDDESAVFQLYSIAMALLGIIGFALLLALTEQILLEVLEANVQQGTTVFERRHLLVLSQCVAGKDMETLWRVLGQVRPGAGLRPNAGDGRHVRSGLTGCLCAQICYAYAADGGRTVVVLGSKDKVVMEKLFRKAIPDRRGSRFIFRKGNPLLPNDLKEVRKGQGPG